MNSIARSSISQQRLVDKFNDQFPVGTKVRYWRGVREGIGKEGVTNHAATLLSGHTAVAWIDGCSGCVSLSHVEPIK
jgi:hypothetical protein